MYNHNGNDITKNKPVHVIMVLIGYVDIGDSSVNAHLCSVSRAFIVLHKNSFDENLYFHVGNFQCLKGNNSKSMQSRVVASLKKIHPPFQKIFHLQDYDLKNQVKVTKM